MSNVLIGIIGVVLFIGLALAGALFLGPQFLNAANNSKASQTMQALQQVAHAAALYKSENSGDLLEEADRNKLTSGGYLKDYPESPFAPQTTDRRLQIKLSNGINDNAAATPGAEARFAIVRLYPDWNTNNIETCKAIVRNLEGAANPTLAGVNGSKPAGCGYFGVTLYAWVRI